MSDIDWAGIKFKIMEEQGENINITFNHHCYEKNITNFYLKPHYEVDGLSGFAQVLKKVSNIETSTLPYINPDNRPSFLGRIKKVVEHLKKQKPIHYYWKKCDVNKIAHPIGYSFALFSKEETKKLIKYCRDNQTNLNSLFLWAIDKECSTYFLTSNQNRKWMVPANIRKKEQSQQFYGNHATALTINTLNSSPQNIYQQIKNDLQSGIIWGGEIVANAPKYLGENIIRKMGKSTKSPYMGLFSNLGKWPIGNKPSDEKKTWVVAPIVSRLCPLACVANYWNEAFNISFMIHPSLTSKINDHEVVLNNIIKTIMKKADIDLNPTLKICRWENVMKQGEFL